MRELPEPKIEVKLPNMLDGDIEVIESFTRDQVLAIQKQAYEDGLRDAGKDAQRIDWFERKLFVKHWNGVVDSGSQVLWNITANWRHTIQRMTGNDFRAAVDAAMLTASQKESQ